MTLCDPHDPDAIARKHAALRRLAASLVSIPDDADDVVQDTWLAALSQRGDRIRNPDGWLQRVARYQAARRRRVDAQRRERELRVARSVLLPEPECRPASERLLQAIEELRDPYRSVVRLRFEEQLSPEAIAARLDRPLTTVKSQLRRALQQVRMRLPELERTSDRRVSSWLWPSFWPGELGRERSALALAGVVAAACVLLLGPTTRWQTDGAPRPPAIARLVPEVQEGLATLDAATGAVAREAAQRSASVALPPQRAASLEVAGRVVDKNGAVAGAPIWVATRGHTEDATIVATSDANGRFLLSDVDSEAWISADGDGWIPSGWASLPAIASPSASRVELSLSMASATSRIAGLVRDPSGLPISGARVFVLADSSTPWFQQGGCRMPGTHPGPTSGVDGTFEVDAHVLTQYLLVIAPGFAPALVGVVISRKGLIPLTVDLEPGATLRGRVSLPRGAAAADAEVQFHPDLPLPVSTVRADAEGDFQLSDLATGWGTLVVLGTGEARALSYRQRLEVSPTSPFVPVELGGEWTIRGTATSADGALPGWTVVAERDSERSSILDRLSARLAPRVETRTDALGRFVFAGLPWQEHRLFLVPPDDPSAVRATALVTVPTGRRPIRLTAARDLACLEGHLALESQELASRCELVLRSPVSGRDRYAAIDPATGAFAFTHLLPGEHELYLWDPAGTPTSLGVWRVGRGTLDVGSVAVPECGSLELALRDLDDRPVEPSAIIVSSREGYGRLQVLEGMQRVGLGVVRTAPLRVGYYDVIVKAPRHAEFATTVLVKRARQPLSIQMERGALVVVSVKLLEDFVPDQEIHLRAERPGSSGAALTLVFTPCANPDRVIWNLPLGTLRIQAWTDEGARASKVFEVQERSDDRAQLVEIELPSAMSARRDTEDK